MNSEDMYALKQIAIQILPYLPSDEAKAAFVLDYARQLLVFVATEGHREGGRRPQHPRHHLRLILPS